MSRTRNNVPIGKEFAIVSENAIELAALRTEIYHVSIWMAIRWTYENDADTFVNLTYITKEQLAELESQVSNKIAEYSALSRNQLKRKYRSYRKGR